MLKLINLKDDNEMLNTIKNFIKKEKNNKITICLNNSDLNLFIKYYDLLKYDIINFLEIKNTNINNYLFNKIIEYNNIKNLKINSCYLETIDIKSNSNLKKIKLVECDKIDINFNDNYDFKLKVLILKDNKFINLNKIIKSNYIKNCLEELDIRNSNLKNINKLCQMKNLKSLKLDKNHFYNIPIEILFIEQLKIGNNYVFFSNIENNLDKIKNLNWLYENLLNYSLAYYKKLFLIFLEDLNSINTNEINIYFNKYIKNYFVVIFNFDMLLLLPEIIDKIKNCINFLCFYLILKYKYFIVLENKLFLILENEIKEKMKLNDYQSFWNSLHFSNNNWNLLIKNNYVNLNMNNYSNIIKFYFLNEIFCVKDYLKSTNYFFIKEEEKEFFGPKYENNIKNGFYLSKNKNLYEIKLFDNNSEIFSFQSSNGHLIDKNYKVLEKIIIFNGINKKYKKIIKNLIINYGDLNYFMIFVEENFIIKLYKNGLLISDKIFNGLQKRYNLVYSDFYHKLFWKKNSGNYLWGGNIILDKKVGKGKLYNNNEKINKEYNNDKEIKIKKLISIMEDSDEDLESKKYTLKDLDLEKDFPNSLNIRTVNEIDLSSIEKKHYITSQKTFYL